MMTTSYGAGQLAFSAMSYSAQSAIFLTQGEHEMILDPADLRAMLAEHDPEGFYDDYPAPEQTGTDA